MSVVAATPSRPSGPSSSHSTSSRAEKCNRLRRTASPPTQQKQKAFKVTKVSKPALRTRTWRADLDYETQSTLVQRHRLDEKYRIDLEGFHSTIATQGEHCRFLNSMISEAYRFHERRLLSKVFSVKAHAHLASWRVYLRVLQSRLMMMMNDDSSDSTVDFYPAAVNMLRYHDLYSPEAPGRSYEIIHTARVTTKLSDEQALYHYMTAVEVHSAH